MIIFYPPSPFECTPVVVMDALDSSDQWGTAEIISAIYQNVPESVIVLSSPSIFSCKYSYEVNHVGVPLDSALRMTLQASIHTPPADLIAQTSVGFVSSSQSIDQMSDAFAIFANPQFKITTAVVVERAGDSTISRSFIAYSVILQPDTYGTTATLFIRAASIDDTLIKSALGFQLVTTLPINTQLIALATSLGYSCTFDGTAGASVPVSGRLFQPATLPKIMNEICLQNKLIPKYEGKNIRIYTQGVEPSPLPGTSNNYEFSFIGYSGNIVWGVGIENYANVKFKTPVFDAKLFDKITMYNDSESAMFTGLKKDSNFLGVLDTPDSYTLYILRYTIIRNDSELCVEVTATNNWLLAQMRVDGIFESKIYGV